MFTVRIRRSLQKLVTRARIYLLKGKSNTAKAVKRSEQWTNTTTRRNPVWFSASVAVSNTGKPKDVPIAIPGPDLSMIDWE